MNTLSKLALTIALGLSSSSFALADDGHPASATRKTAEASASMAEGEVKRIDKDAGKVTIKHGELKNLDMPPMTMVFRVKDPAMLDQVKVGDKIGFLAERVNGAITVTKLEPAK